MRLYFSLCPFIAMMTGELHLGVHGVPGPQWVLETGAHDCVSEMALLDPLGGTASLLCD